MTNATNQKKGIVHRGSGHIAESTEVSLPYFETGQEGGTVMDDNHIEVWKCAKSTAAQRTFIEGQQVIHHQTAIGHPYGDGTSGHMSRYDRPHGNAQNNPPVFAWFAIAHEKSPDVKVEGKWVVRTFDKTIQDAGNGPGRFSPGAGKAEITDESELLFQQCAVEKIELICSHERSTMEGELHVFIGDTVTVKAYRMNASETDPKKRLDIHCHLPLLREKKKPPAEETRHAAFVLSRNSGGIPLATTNWTAIEPKTLVGRDEIITEGEVPKAGRAHVTELFLDKEWLLEADEPLELEVEAGDGVGAQKDREFAERKLARAQRRERKARAAPGRPGKKSGALGQARRDVTNAQRQLDDIKAEEEKRTANQKAGEAIVNTTKLLLQSWSIIMDYFLYKPLTINIEAHGCSPGATATIKAYPIEEFNAELAVLKDFPFTKTVERMSNLIDTITSFFKNIDVATIRNIAGANPGFGARTEFDIDVYFFRSFKGEKDGDPSVALTFGFQELKRDSNPNDGEVANRKAWQIHKFWEVEIGLERLFGLSISFEVDLSFCAGIGKVIAAILTFCGVKTGVFLNISVSLSVGIGGSVSRDEYGKWDFAFAKVPVKSVIDLAIIARLGKLFEAALHLTGSWAPSIDLGTNDKGQLCLERSESKIVISLVFSAKVDVLGWDLEASYTFAKWEIPVPGSPIVIFGDGA
jgi:hypothetical protein